MHRVPLSHFPLSPVRTAGAPLVAGVRRSTPAALTVLLLALAPSVCRAAEQPLSAVLERFGMHAVVPPTPAPDFTLPGVEGVQRSLSDAEGSWVVLTFFATWCGPCVGEMPSLERLHEEHGEDRLTVLGVSIDRSRAPLADFVDRYHLNFPVLWDGEGRVARLYQATSIPLSYLVDPRGRIRGVARGSRDWGAMGGLVEAALASSAGEEAGAGLYDRTAQQVALPAQLVPPTATVELARDTVGVGQPVQVAVRIRWSGSFDDYLLHPPKLHLPDGVSQSAVSASTSSLTGKNVVTYRIEVAAERPGRFALDPVELRYTPRAEGAPVTTRVPGPTLTVQRSGLARLSAAAAGGTAGVLLLATAGSWLLWRRRRGGDGSDAPQSTRRQRLAAACETARRRRIEGDLRGCAEALYALQEELGGPGAVAEGAVERLRYGGDVPAPQELDFLLRQVERQVEALAPRPEEQERARLRLRRSPADSVHPEVS